MKISIIITSFKESHLISRSINSFLKQDLLKNYKKNKIDYEIIVLAPDKETLEVVKDFSRKNPRIRSIKDPGKGKPTALNIGFSKAKGDLLILTDGDVYVSNISLKYLIKHFKENKIGLGGVSARVVSTNDLKKMFGFWAFLLTNGFHKLRLKQTRLNKNIICSGYLYAIKSNIIKKIPEDALADDAFISLMLNKKSHKTIYEPHAKVFVLYPDNLVDWIKQKKRTAARYYQLNNYFKFSKTSSLFEEISVGIKSLLNLKSFKRIFWFFLLIILRFYIWFRVIFDKRLWKRSFNKTWLRVKSTKH